MARDLLIEIGVEELPASFLTHGLDAMKATIGRLLEESRLEAAGEPRTLGTPRRLALLVPGVSELQADRRETVMGPPWSVAFGADGKLTRAGEGFARKQNVDPSAIERLSTDKGDYASLAVHETGRHAVEVLPGVLAELCRRVSFPKAMRWGDGDVAFGRPIHWLVGLFGNAVLPFEFAGIRAGRQSRGHRFLSPDVFDVPSASQYVERLAAAHVWVDLEQRSARMRESLDAAAAALGGELVEDEFLLRECVSLVEEPFVVPGQFAPRFLELPDEVVVSVMRDHQRYLAVREAGSGKLMPAYLNVVNTAHDPVTIAKGNDRVLRARLSDAAFFVTEDRKARLIDRVPRLSHVVFQAKLGSVGEKVQRIAALAEALAARIEGLSMAEVGEAAQLCKADLETLIVGEFPELQGEMGRWYALSEGVAPQVADAIRDHYRPQGSSDALPAGPIGALVSVADKADTLVGCFGVGLTPTGSADPFALRRAALGIVRIALEGPIDVHLTELLAHSYDLYQGTPLAPRESVLGALAEFFRGRLRAFYRERFPGDLVDACLAAWEGGSIRDLEVRLRAVDRFRVRPEYESLAVAFKRAHNIAKDTVPGAYDEGLLEDGPERELSRCFEQLRPRIDASVSEGSYDSALELLATELRGPIDRYFEEVFVMVDDAKVRDNRLRLLKGIAVTVTQIAHFHQLST